jgi:hypothetical protein
MQQLSVDSMLNYFFKVWWFYFQWAHYDNFAFTEFIWQFCFQWIFFLLFVNIVVNNCPSPRFHTIPMLIFTCYYTWHFGLIIVGRIYGPHHCRGFNSAYVYVNINDQFVMIKMMKISCLKIIVSYVELSCKFLLIVEIMSILGMMYA